MFRVLFINYAHVLSVQCSDVFSLQWCSISVFMFSITLRVQFLVFQSYSVFAVKFFNDACCSVFSFDSAITVQCSVFQWCFMFSCFVVRCSIFLIMLIVRCSVFQWCLLFSVQFSMMLIVQCSVFNDAYCSVFSFSIMLIVRCSVFQWCLLFSVPFSMLLIVQCSVFNDAYCSVFSFLKKECTVINV